MTDTSNQTIPVRAGEQLSLDRLTEYLREQLPPFPGELGVEQFPHGHSNLTYLLSMGDQKYVLRRPPHGNQVATAHDMGREYRMLSRLNAVFPTAPRPLLNCEDSDILGSPFYLMEYRQGLVLRKTIPSRLAIDESLARRMSTSLIDHLAELHAIDYQAAGLSDMGKPEGYVARQVAGWSKRYAQAQTSVVPSMERLSKWLTDNQPTESGAAIIHNDFKYDNVMLDPQDLTRIVAVLDWEMATLGDPLMDLGTTLGYWVEADDPPSLKQAAFGPTALPGSLTRADVVHRYQERTGRTIAQLEFYYVFGLFKLAVIVQQIYARFVRGHTADSRFAHLDQLVLLLGQQADRVLDSGKLSAR